MKYTVWVGGTEVTDYHVDFDIALSIALQWRGDGYEDVKIEQVSE